MRSCFFLKKNDQQYASLPFPQFNKARWNIHRLHLFATAAACAKTAPRTSARYYSKAPGFDYISHNNATRKQQPCDRINNSCFIDTGNDR
jgi:hypothetical protein